MSPLSRASGGANTAVPTQYQTVPRHQWGAATRETVTTFENCWGGQHSGVPRRPKRDLAIRGGLRRVKLAP
eukprot:5901742-Pyramimonas_sp.AAC.1